MKNSKYFGPLMILMAAVLWSLIGIFTKSNPWDGFALSALRGTVSFFGVLILILFRGKKITLNKTKIIVSVCYFTQGVLFVCSHKLTTSGNATVIQNISPLFIILFTALISKKMPTKQDVLVCALLFIGIGLTFAGDFSSGGNFGNLLALISAVFYAGVYFFNRQEGADPLESLLLGNALYLLMIPYLIINPTVRSTSPQEFIKLAFLGTISGFGAWLCFSFGIKYTEALQAGFIALMEPTLAIVWSFLILKENIRPLSLIGCLIVLGTLVIYNVIKLRKEPAPQTGKTE